MSSQPTTSSSTAQALSLNALFRRALTSASDAYNLPTIEPKTQDLIRSALSDLKDVATRVDALSLFSANEGVEDLGTREMVFLFVPYVRAEVGARVNVGVEPGERLGVVRESVMHLERFVKVLGDYDIISDADRSTFDTTGAAAVQDPGRRREVKIAQGRKQKEIRDKIKALKHRQNQPIDEFPNDYDLIASLLPAPNTNTNADDEDEQDDEVLRELALLLLRLLWTQAVSNTAMMQQEIDMLQHAARNPPPPRPPQGERGTGGDDQAWRLDRIPGGAGPDGRGPLLDAQGRPLRTFTIVSGQQADRARIQAEVFRPDHRLPTMSIDEYLAEEKRRGNIISGGGAASQNAPTSSEILQADSEQDGTLFGEDKSEEKRRKDEEWAVFTERNPKGSGNTMNRG